MLCNNHPAISYVAWYGLVIMVKEKRIETKDDGSTTEVEVETPYIISDGKSCMKYLYWDKTNPYVLKEDNVWVEESSSQKMIYINENGTATEVPHSDISLYYNDTGNGASAKLTGEALGKFDELNGKYMIVKEDVDGIKEVLGTEGTETGGTLIDRLNKVEKTAEKTTEEISTVRKDFANSKELETLRNNLNIAMIDLGEVLSYYRDSWGEMSKDLEVSSDERRDINQKQADLLNAYTTLGTYHSTLIERLENSEEDNSNTISNLNISFQALKTSIDNLNKTVTTAISDNTIVPSEITTVLNMMTNVALKNNEYKNTVSDSILLGVGGRLTESVLDIRKTSSEFSQTISDIEYEIDGETGLKVQIKDNKTAIEQNSKEINLKCVKFNDTTSQLTVGDGFIKLDASKVLMTGTLTWDSLDDEARQNLKGEAGSAEFISLTGEQVIKYDKNNNPNLTTITLNTVISNIDNPTFTWYYKRENQTTWTTMKNTAQSIQIAHNDSAIWGGTNSVTIKVAVRDDLYDQMTIIKLYDGIKGDTAKYVTLEGEQLFKYTNNFTGTPSPTSITLIGKRYGISSSNTKWYYKTTSSWTQITSANGSDTLTITPNDYFGSSRVVTIKYEVDTYSDQITIAKVSDGATGNAGKDAYYVYLTNEAHVVSCDEDGNYTSEELNKATTYIKAYKGTTARTDFSVTKTDSGCVSSFDSSSKLLKITSLTSKTATVSLNITIDGLTFNKTMSIAKSIKGDIGTGLNVLGELDSVSQLPSTANPGDAYIINDLLYVWKENVKKWSDGMPFRGEKGVPGEKGEDGRTTYTHIKYSNDGKTFTSNNGEDVGDWMGIYTDFTEADSTTFSHYKWKKIKGNDGDNGIVANLSNDSHSVPTDANGNNGNFSGCNSKITLSYNGVVISSGVTYSYSKSTSISGSYDTSTGTYTVSSLSDNTGYIDLKATYNGVTYTKRFTVTKNKSGVNGNDAYTINLSNENHSFLANQDGRIETQQSTTTVITAYKGTTSVTPTIGTLPSVSGLTLSKSGTTVTIVAPVGTSLANQGSFNIPVTVDGKTFNQAFSYVKVNAGKNGYTVILTNESHAFPCENNGNIPSAISTTTVVKAYKGTSEVTPTIGTLPSVSGLTLSKSGATITIKANAGTSLSASGKFDIPITVDGVNFTKSFSWAKAYKGNTGSPGTPGSSANIPSWITEWDNGKTTINGSTVLSPKIFAGSVSNGKPTGVAIGKNVFGTSGSYANVNGIAGYMNGTKTYSFSTDGKVNIGNSSNYLNWDGSTLTISGKVNITDGSYSGTSFSDIRKGAILANGWVKNSTYIDGAKIYTGSITANQIQANAITSDKIQANAINGKNITGGTINIGGGTFVVNSSGQIKARTEANEKGQYLDMSSSTYKIWRNSKCCMQIGFRDLTFENGNTVTGTPAIYMGADGIDPYGGNSYTGETGRYYARWYTTDHNNSQTASHANMPTMMFEFNTKYKNANTGRPIASQIKMYGDGDMRIAPAGALEIYTHKTNNAINADGDEELIAKFTSSTSDYYPSRFEVSAVCNMKNSKGLRLADYYKSSAGNGYDGTDFMAMAEVRAGYYSNGDKFRTFRPHLDNAMELGSGSYRWKKVFSAVSTISTSDRRCKTNIEYLTAENKKVSTNCMTTKEEIWEFVKDIDYASYNFINGEGEADKDNQFGFILQDLLQSHPDLTTDLILDNSSRNPVEGEDTGEAPLMGYNTGNYVNILGCALQQALQRIEVLENKLNDK